MKIIDNTLYLDFKEAVEAGINGSTISLASHRKSPSWHIINDLKDKRRILIGYEKLSDTNKEKVNKRYGNPYDYLAKEPIRKLVTTDFEAEQFFHKYRYDGDKFLPAEHRKKYLTAASWLNTFIKLNEDKKIIKKELQLSLEEFWNNCCEIIKTDEIALPSTYQRLRTKMSEYKEKRL